MQNTNHESASINEKMIQILTIEDFEYIFSNEKLILHDENSFFNIIVSIINEKGELFMNLIDFIEFKYLNEESIKIFQNYFMRINEQFSLFHPRLISSLFGRLLLSVQPPQHSLRYFSSESIIAYLTEKSGGNIYANNTISVEFSHKCGGSIQELFNKNNHTYFRLVNQIEGFILLDFKKYRINIDKYIFSVPSQFSGASDGRPKSWTIEASNDKINWIEISKVENNFNLNSYGSQQTFYCQNRTIGFYQYIRINEKMSQSSNHYFL